MLLTGGLRVFFFAELSALYHSFADGKPSPLPDLHIQYADFACWQRKWMQGEMLEKQLSYWKDHLSDIPTVLELPSDRPRPVKRSLKGASHDVILTEKLVDRLRSISKNEGVTMFTLMMAAFKTLLYRYTNQGDICVGTFVANRNRVEIENLIGFFVNTLVLRTDLSDNPGFLELLEREHQIALGAFAHQDVPFETLLETLQPKTGDKLYAHFSRSLFLLRICLTSRSNLPGLSFEFISTEPRNIAL